MLTAHQRITLARREPGAQIEARGLVVLTSPEGEAVAVHLLGEWAVSPAAFEAKPAPVMAAAAVLREVLGCGFVLAIHAPTTAAPGIFELDRRGPDCACDWDSLCPPASAPRPPARTRCR